MAQMIIIRCPSELLPTPRVSNEHFLTNLEQLECLSIQGSFVGLLTIIRQFKSSKIV